MTATSLSHFIFVPGRLQRCDVKSSRPRVCTVSWASLAELQSWSQATPAWIRATLSSPPPVSHLHGNPAACCQTSFQKFPLFSFLLPVVHSGSSLLFLDPHPVFQSDLSHPCSTNKSTSRPNCHSEEEL